MLSSLENNKKFNKYLSGFTIPEAMIMLLIATLVTVVAVPAITKKHKTAEVHGKWTCTVDNNGNHYVMTEYNGIESDFKATGNSCIFTPPANAKTFNVKAVAGGGGGAGGESGAEEVVYDTSSAGETFVTAVQTDGYYTIMATGGGGGGGGLSCGEASDHYSKTVDEVIDFRKGQLTALSYEDSAFWDESEQGYNATKLNNYIKDLEYDTRNKGLYVSGASYQGQIYTYGYADLPVSDFDYKYLIKNDARFSPEDINPNPPKSRWVNEYGTKQDAVSIYDFKYKHLKDVEFLMNRNLCFASEKNIPFSKEYQIKDSGKLFKGMYQQYYNHNLVCWNLPAEGGNTGVTKSETNVFLSAGQNIIVNTGRGGKGVKSSDTTKQKIGLFAPEKPNSSVPTTYEVLLNGLGGSDGTATNVIAGATKVDAAGGSGGYGRTIQNVQYKNIPVRECAIQRGTKSYPNYGSSSVCTSRSPNQCEDKTGCVLTSDTRYTGCTGDNSCKGYGSAYSCSRATYKVPVVNEEGVTEEVPHNCTPTYETHYSCDVGTHSGPHFYVGTSCRTVVRPTYFEVPVCIQTKLGDSSVDSLLKDDLPKIFGNKAALKRFWYGDEYQSVELHESYTGPDVISGIEYPYGSGGYGVGEMSKTYFEHVINDKGEHEFKPRFYGYDGQDGSATVKKISYSGGGGGQAGQYSSFILKKTGKLKVEIGKGGQPTGDGGSTVITNYLTNDVLISLNGGKAGLPNSTASKMVSSDVMGGVDGALSPFESPYNKARIIPYGGKQGTNLLYDGVSPATPKWAGTGGTTGYLSITYGAGGGGGAADKEKAGVGGFGAPGAVVIEW